MKPPIPGLYLARAPRALHIHADSPLSILSSAVVGGGQTQARHILNVQVPRDYDGADPAGDLAAAARDLGLGGEPFVGLMTAASLERVQVLVEREGPIAVVAIVTIGLSRPEAAGVTEAFHLAPTSAGTINIVVLMDAALAPGAAVNAVITATEAKTLALVEGGVRAPHGGPASGTGTDAVVAAWTGRGAPCEYAGPISPIGALIGRAVRRAMLNSLAI